MSSIFIVSGAVTGRESKSECRSEIKNKNIRKKKALGG